MNDRETGRQKHRKTMKLEMTERQKKMKLGMTERQKDRKT